MTVAARCSTTSRGCFRRMRRAATTSPSWGRRAGRQRHRSARRLTDAPSVPAHAPGERWVAPRRWSTTARSPRASDDPSARGTRVAGWWTDARAAAVAEALARLAWHDLTDRTLAQQVVGAVDRYVVLRFVSNIPGAKAGRVGPVEPADTRHVRVDPLARGLAGREWRDFSLDRLCADLITALVAWQAEWESVPGTSGEVEDR